MLLVINFFLVVVSFFFFFFLGGGDEWMRSEELYYLHTGKQGKQKSPAMDIAIFLYSVWKYFWSNIVGYMKIGLLYDLRFLVRQFSVRVKRSKHRIKSNFQNYSVWGEKTQWPSSFFFFFCTQIHYLCFGADEVREGIWIRKDCKIKTGDWDERVEPIQTTVSYFETITQVVFFLLSRFFQFFFFSLYYFYLFIIISPRFPLFGRPDSHSLKCASSMAVIPRMVFLRFLCWRNC